MKKELQRSLTFFLMFIISTSVAQPIILKINTKAMHSFLPCLFVNSSISSNEMSSEYYLYMGLVVLLLVALAAVLFFYIQKQRKMQTIIKSQKQAQNDLIDLYSSVQLLTADTSVKVFIYDLSNDTVYHFVNNTFEKCILKWNDFFQNVHEEDILIHNTAVDEIIKKQKDKIQYTLRLFDNELNAYQNYEFILTSIKDQKGQVIRLLFSQQNIFENPDIISRHKTTIKALNMAIRSANILAWSYEIKTKKKIVAEGFGVESKLVEDMGMECIAEKDTKRVADFIESVIQGTAVSNKIIAEMKFPNSTDYRMYEFSVIAERQEDGKVVLLWGTTRDVSDIYYYQKELSDKINVLEAVNRNMPVGLIFYNQSGTITGANDYLINLLSIDKFKMDNLNITLFDINYIPESVKEAVKRKEVGRFELRYEDHYSEFKDYLIEVTTHGSVFDIAIAPTLSSEGEVLGYIGVVNDISETYENKKRIENLQTNLTLALSASNTSVWTFDIEKREFRNLQGAAINKGLLSEEQYLSFVHPEDHNTFQNYIDIIASGKTGKLSACVRLKVNDEWSWQQCDVLGIKENGVVKQLIGTRKDITEEIKAKEQLNALNKQNMLILNNNRSGLVYIDKDYNVQWSNTESFFKNKSNGSIYRTGQKCYESFGKTETCLECPVLKAFETKEVCSREFDKGESGVFETIAIPIIENGKIEGAVLRIDDITERKRLIEDLTQTKESTERLNTELSSANALMSTILDEMPGILFIKDVKDGYRYIVASNEFCANTVGLPREKVIGYTDYEVFQDRAIADKFRRDDMAIIQSKSDNIVDIGEERVFTDGKERIVQTKKLAVRLSNNQELLIGICVDITDITLMNERLIESKEKAEQSDRLKSAFLANMSHEIRTPLNSIVGFSELLQTTEDESERETYMNIINFNNDLLLRLINDILDFSKIESGTIELRPETFDISATFNETFESMRLRCTNPNVELINNVPFDKCIITVDSKRLLQVEMNFLTNAIKHTDKGCITMGYDYIDNGILVYVKDTGRGIPEHKQHLIFGRFEKLDSFTQGTGLGLAISKAIVETQGGRIGFESKENEGSYFWAWIPCEAEKISIDANNNIQIEDNTTENLIMEPNNERIMKILVAEDNDSNFLLVRALLKGHELIRANNGQEAVALASEGKYDLILMDIKMPIMDGLEATRQIRKFDTETKIIALTANTFDSDRANATEAGCNGFVAKPIKKGELEAVIHNL